tara:strand:+ start:506 stop:1138 length:633 start_codon:yes stop_codon:yes gene_type:complete
MSNKINNNKRKKRDNGYRIIRLVNGEKLIAKITNSSDKKLFLERPMTISGIINTKAIGPMHMIKKEFLVLNNWIEFCQNNTVGVSKDFILTISDPDDFIIDAYDVQKEHEDVGIDRRCRNNNKQFGDQPDDLFSNCSDEEIQSMLENIGMDFNINDVVNQIIQNNINNYDDDDVEWSEEDIDKSRGDYGNDMDDWSPYYDDYFDDRDHNS